MSNSVQLERASATTTTNGRKIHLGCFDQYLQGWENTDISPHLHIAKIPFLPWVLFKLKLMPEQRYQQHKQGIFKNIKRLDITKKFAYGDNQFSAAFCSHVMEHLFPEQAMNCAKEVCRILKPGGVFRVSVPDLDRLIAEYDPEKSEKWIETFFEGRQVRDKNRHHWMYNEKNMRQLLLTAGFSEIRRCEFGQGLCPEVEKIDNRPESLFMEAIK